MILYQYVLHSYRHIYIYEVSFVCWTPRQLYASVSLQQVRFSPWKHILSAAKRSVFNATLNWASPWRHWRACPWSRDWLLDCLIWLHCGLKDWYVQYVYHVHVLLLHYRKYLMEWYICEWVSWDEEISVFDTCLHEQGNTHLCMILHHNGCSWRSSSNQTHK